MKKLILLTFLFLLQGCSAYEIWYGSDKPIMSWVYIDGATGAVQRGVTEDEVPEGLQGYIVTWSPRFNGAFVTKTGVGCVQPAVYSKNQSGSAEVPAAIITGVPTEGSLAGSYVETIEKLIKVNDQSTFLSIGMYGICQLAASNLLNADDTAKMVEKLLDKAALLDGSDPVKPVKPTGVEVKPK